MMENYAIIADNGGSNQRYRDIVGEVYTFPSMYERILVPGTKFVYQRCGLSSMKVNEPDCERLLDEPHYFGTAEIGKVTEVSAGMFEAEIINYKHFVKGVPFRLADGSHFEVANGQFWRNGVRSSQKEVYDEIVSASNGTIPATSPLAHLLPPLKLTSVVVPKTENRRVTARNRSSVQIKDSLPMIGLRSQSFANDCLEIVTDKTHYWLHSLVDDKYYSMAKIDGIFYRDGIIKIRPKIISYEPRIRSDKEFGIWHISSYAENEVGQIKINHTDVEFHGKWNSQKNVDGVTIPIEIAE